MAEKVSNVLEGWSKWQVAVAVGAPIALGLAGLWYYKRRSPGASPTVEEKVQPKEKKAESEPQVPKVSVGEDAHDLQEHVLQKLSAIVRM